MEKGNQRSSHKKTRQTKHHVEGTNRVRRMDTRNMGTTPHRGNWASKTKKTTSPPHVLGQKCKTRRVKSTPTPLAPKSLGVTTLFKRLLTFPLTLRSQWITSLGEHMGGMGKPAPLLSIAVGRALSSTGIMTLPNQIAPCPRQLSIPLLLLRTTLTGVA